jgi:uncharacterized membrane protein YjjP (DUF1212 family)
MVEALGEQSRTYRPSLVLLGYGMAAAFFTPLFGGGIADALCALVCGTVVGICLLFGGKLIGNNGFFRTLVCSAVASLLSLVLVRMGLGQSVDIVTIGTLMLLVPGVALTNAMREIMAGDIISGISRMAEAILVATAIALGAVVGLAIGRII